MVIAYPMFGGHKKRLQNAAKVQCAFAASESRS
jgi:hypothetical protein